MPSAPLAYTLPPSALGSLKAVRRNQCGAGASSISRGCSRRLQSSSSRRRLRPGHQQSGERCPCLCRYLPQPPSPSAFRPGLCLQPLEPFDLLPGLSANPHPMNPGEPIGHQEFCQILIADADYAILPSVGFPAEDSLPGTNWTALIPLSSPTFLAPPRINVPTSFTCSSVSHPTKSEE